MAARGRQTHCQPARQQVTLKPDLKKSREQETSRSAPSGDVWDYYLGEGLKARFIKRHSKADQKPVCAPEVWVYDSDDTILYDPDMYENLKALDIRHRDKALVHMPSDSVSNDSSSHLSGVQRDNDSNDKKPVCEPEVWDYDSDDTIPYGPDMSDNLKALVIRHRDKALEQMSSDSVSNDSSSHLSGVQRGNDSNDKNTCHLDIEVAPVPDPVLNTCSINRDYFNSVDIANIRSIEDDVAMDITIELPNAHSHRGMNAVDMEFINNLTVGREMYDNTNQDEFDEFLNFLNDDEMSNIDDFMNHNLQQQHG